MDKQHPFMIAHKEQLTLGQAISLCKLRARAIEAADPLIDTAGIDRLLGVTAASKTAWLDAFEKKELGKREINPADRRKQFFRLTKKGEKLADSMA